MGKTVGSAKWGAWGMETGDGRWEGRCNGKETGDDSFPSSTPLNFPSPRLELTNQPTDQPASPTYSKPLPRPLSRLHRFLPKWATHALTGHTLRRSRPSLQSPILLHVLYFFADNNVSCLAIAHSLAHLVSGNDHQKIQDHQDFLPSEI